MKTKVRSFIQVSHTGSSGPHTWTIFCCFSQAVSRALDLKWRREYILSPIQDASVISCNFINQYHNISTSLPPPTAMHILSKFVRLQMYQFNTRKSFLFQQSMYYFFFFFTVLKVKDLVPHCPFPHLPHFPIPLLFHELSQQSLSNNQKIKS